MPSEAQPRLPAPRPTARRLAAGCAGGWAAVCAAILLAGAPVALAADGGPSLNIPVPATARTGGATGPTTTPAVPAGTSTATTPAGTATAPAGGAAAPGTTTLPAATTPTTGATATATTTAPPGPAAAHPAPARAKRGSSGTSTTAIVLAAVGAALVLLCAAWAIVRARGVEPHWTLSLRHAMAETSHRASATWAELGDWLRLGR